VPFAPKFTITSTIATALMRIEAAKEAMRHLPITLFRGGRQSSALISRRQVLPPVRTGLWLLKVMTVRPVKHGRSKRLASALALVRLRPACGGGEEAAFPGSFHIVGSLRQQGRSEGQPGGTPQARCRPGTLRRFSRAARRDDNAPAQ
jgi:hypothetical protein